MKVKITKCPSNKSMSLAFGQNTKGDIELGFNTGINFSQVGNNTGNSDVSIG
jgi:hypothetical protein